MDSLNEWLHWTVTATTLIWLVIGSYLSSFNTENFLTAITSITDLQESIAKLED